MNKKYIFVSGGVISGLGKGTAAASLAVLLQARGYKVTFIKCENYLNLDSGNINPIEHGDVFLCEDGLEADLDLGSYERFLNKPVGRKNFTTMGQIYLQVIENTKNLQYDGKTVDAIPYVPEEVINRIQAAAGDDQIILVELGGTAGEYQNVIYYEAYRIMKLRFPEDVLHIHLTYFPSPPHVNELKSKPTQLSVKWLNQMGIQPDIILGRAESRIDKKRRQKVAFYCNLDEEDVFSAPDLDSIYKLPLEFADQGLDEQVVKLLNLPESKPDLEPWRELIAKIDAPKQTKVKISIVAKYLQTGEYQLQDSYASLLEALTHASWQQNYQLDINFIDAEKLEKIENIEAEFASSQGIIVPIGWGSRGVEGKIKSIQYARENQIPYLGLCYGMQLVAVEYARNVLGLKDAHTTEVNPNTSDPIIYDIPFDPKHQTIKGDGASMRLGGFDCRVKTGSLADQIYTRHQQYKDEAKKIISERHRHRYEFNNKYRDKLEENGLVISGTSMDNNFVEMLELPQEKHPFFIATQAHPEYKSRPLKPHSIFIEFLKAAVEYQG